MNTFETPILLLVFNRPNHTRKVLERIREMKPKYLFVAADGPRSSHPDDQRKSELVREIIVQGVDWECELKTLFRDENLGCGRGPAGAITWFFEIVEQGIILEDDCIPNKAFFKFSESLLNHFKSKENVMHIGGGTYASRNCIDTRESYYYSKYSYCWGWATWRRAWLNYDERMQGLENFIENDLKSICTRKTEYEFWASTLIDDREKVDTWDHKWNYAIWKNRGLCIHSTHNYIKNIGFDQDATHTFVENENYKMIDVEEILENIKHPTRVEINEKADTNVFEKYSLSKRGPVFKILLNKFLNKIK